MNKNYFSLKIPTHFYFRKQSKYVTLLLNKMFDKKVQEMYLYMQCKLRWSKLKFLHTKRFEQKIGKQGRKKYYVTAIRSKKYFGFKRLKGSICQGEREKEKLFVEFCNIAVYCVSLFTRDFRIVQFLVKTEYLEVIEGKATTKLHIHWKIKLKAKTLMISLFA